MSKNHFRKYIETLQQQILVRKGEVAGTWEEIAAALESLQQIYDEMQASLDTATLVEEGLLEENVRLARSYQNYYELFQFLPLGYLLTDATGLILEANQAIAKLLNIPQHYLIGKPLTVFIAEGSRRDFRTKLNRLEQVTEVQVWEVSLCPRKSQPLVAEFHVASVRSQTGSIEALRIGVYKNSRSQETVAQLPQGLKREEISLEVTKPQSGLPKSLDGLQVLIVDDEADVREFITAVLETYGIGVRAVASAAAALEELERFRPDILLSDIRMPGEDGYHLIRQIRDLEDRKAGHIRAAAITAYLDEDREKSLEAGFEAHLYKLAHPSEWVEMVTQLAGQTSSRKQDL